MKAALLTRYGEPLSFADVPPPIMGDNDVLIDVHATSINPVDVKIRAGGQRGVMRYTLPRIGGMDVSGVVAAVGSAVRGFQVGDAVFSSPGFRRPGCFAEQVAVPAAEVAKKPDNLSHDEAATVPLVALTAWQCLMPRLAERPRGQKVFIQAGSGGVGTVAIQIARHYGAHVATTCSPRNTQLVQSLGAETVIDYRTQRFEDVLSDMDLVLDALGGAERDRAFAVLRRGGRLASIVSGLPDYTKRYGPNLAVGAVLYQLARFKLRGLLAGVEAESVIRKPAGDQLGEIGRLVEKGALRPIVERVYPFAEINAAMDHVEGGRTRGKVAVALR